MESRLDDYTSAVSRLTSRFLDLPHSRRRVALDGNRQNGRRRDANSRRRAERQAKLEPESSEAETGLDPEVAKFKQEYLACRGHGKELDHEKS
jgi:hypothetical protein